MKKIIIGAEEVLMLPDLDLQLTARIDTGAQTSSLHVERLKLVKIDNKRTVYFDVSPQENTSAIDDDDTSSYQFCLPVVAVRKIKSSNGEAESRPVIKTHLLMNNHRWTIELTLSNREQMTYPMLLGREAMGKRVLVSPSERFLLDKPLNKNTQQNE